MKLCGLLSLLAALFIAGCAKKKEAPPRGSVFGFAQLSASLSKSYRDNMLREEREFDVSAHCLQAVELRDGTKIIELSDVACPTDNSLVGGSSVRASMRFYSEMEGPGSLSYLVMGSAKALDENTDVAVVKNVTSEKDSMPRFEVQFLCQDIPNQKLSRNCKVNFATRGSIESISFSKSRPINLVRRHSIDELYAADDAIRKDLAAANDKMDKMDERLKNQISALDTKLTNRIDAEVKSLNESIGKVSTALNTAVTRLDKKDGELEAKDVELNKSITQAVEKAAKELGTEITERKGEDAKLAGEIKTLGMSIDKVGKDLGDESKNRKSEDEKLAGEIKTNGMDIKKVDEQRSKDAEKFNAEVVKLQTNIDKSIEAAKDADKALQTGIDNLKADLKKIDEAGVKKDGELQTAIDGVKNDLKGLTELQDNNKKIQEKLEALQKKLDELAKKVMPMENQDEAPAEAETPGSN